MHAKLHAGLLSIAAMAAMAAGAGIGTAHAGSVFTVNATFNTTGFQSDNTSITVTNTSGALETNIDLFSGGSSELLGQLAAGQSATYYFNESNGPFILQPGDKGLPDTTSYQVSALVAGTTVTTSAFSPVSNLTGGYVDFLGDCYDFSTGCSVDPTVNYPLTGVVAQGVAAPVPLPPSLALFAGGLLGLGAMRRRLL